MFWDNVRVRNLFKCFSGYITSVALTLSSVSPICIHGMEFDEEVFDAKAWNLLEKVKKLMKPIKALNENSSIEEIAKAAGDFKKKLDKIYNTGISIDKAFDMAIQELANNGVFIEKKS